MSAADLGITALAGLGTYLLHSTLILGGIWVVCALRPLRSPRLRERVWTFGILGGFLTAGLQLAIGVDPVFGRLRLATPAAPVELIVAGDPVARDAVEANEESLEGIVEEEPAPEPPPLVRCAPEEGELEIAGCAIVELEEARRLAREGERNRPIVMREPTLREERFESDEACAGCLLLTSATPEEPATTEETDEPPAALATSTGSPGEGGGAATGPKTERWRDVAAVAMRIGSGLVRSARGVPWTPALVGAWILAGLGGICWFLCTWSRLFLHLRRRHTVTEGAVLETLEELRREAGVRARVRLSVSPTVPGPITLGILRGEICLPERALGGLTPAQTRAMLAHELAHVRRRDAVRFHAFALIERVFFFQPLNRVARRQLRETAEILCDDLAVRWTGQRLALASCLTEIARWLIGDRRRALPAPGMAESRSRLGQRIERLLDDRRSPRPERPHRWFPPVATVLVGLVVAAVPGITSGASPVAEPETIPAAPAKHTELVELDEALETIESVEIREVAELLAEVPTTELDLTTPAAAFRFQKELLEMSLAALEEELELTRRELEDMELTETFAELLDHIDHRVRTLRTQGERVDELLMELSDTFDTLSDDVDTGADFDIENDHHDDFPFPVLGERR